jgi:uncharacterized protein (DUF58 family)
MKSHPTRKTVGSVGLITALFVAALISGRVELIAVAAPLLVAVSVALARTANPDIRAVVSVPVDRCLEGDEVVFTISVTGSSSVAELDVALLTPKGFSPVGPTINRVRLVPGGVEEWAVTLKAERWGLHRIGGTALRAWGTGRYVVAESVLPHALDLKVFPRFERIVAGLIPPEPQVSSGEYVSRSAGPGIEFASVREFRPGDEIRNVNWKVTSRRAGMHVNTFHPERNSDVVLFLDTFGDHGDGVTAGSLELAVRGAAGIALHHLRKRDRVGIISFGGVIRWLPVSVAAAHVYRVLDILLDAQVRFSYAWKNVGFLPAKTLPAGALVVAFSPLVDERAVRALQDLQERGFSLLIVDTLPTGAIEPSPGTEGELAHRVWKLQRAAVRTEFGSRGVPVVGWSEEDFLDSVLAVVPHLPKVRRGQGA